jgi:hypothetical protein
MRRRSCSLLLVALSTILASTLIAGCGSSSGPSQAELAAQDKQVQAADRDAAALARVVAFAQRLKRQRELVRIAVLHARRVRRLQVRRETVLQLQSAGFAAGNPCAPIRGGGPASRRERRLLRRQLLFELNLRC